MCIVDSSGDIIQAYGGSPETDQINDPCHLAVNGRDNVLVVSRSNSRVLLSSPSLMYLGDIVSAAGLDLIDPYTIHFDKLCHRLYIGEWDGQGMLVLGVNN